MYSPLGVKEHSPDADAQPNRPTIKCGNRINTSLLASCSDKFHFNLVPGAFQSRFISIRNVLLCFTVSL